MKKILIIMSIVLTSIACKAQNNIVDYNKIYVNNISIASFNPNDFESTIGSQETSTDDMGFITDVFKKNENRFSFFKNSHHGETDPYTNGDLISFDIMDSSISVKINSTSFKVGDNIAILKTVFPYSYIQGKHHNAIKIGFRGDMNGGDWLSDNSLIIRYDGISETIKDIHLYYTL